MLDKAVVPPTVAFVIVFAVMLSPMARARTSNRLTPSGSPPLFAPAVVYATGGQYSAGAATEDLNGDGRPDLVVVNGCLSSSDCSSGTVGVLLGNGDGTFQAVTTYGSGGYGPVSVAVGDVNGDGKPDLVVAECASSSDCSGTVGVLIGNGNGTFQMAVAYSTGGYYASSVAIEDVNRDGRPDILAAHQCVAVDDCSSGTLGVLLGDGGGAFQSAKTYATGGYFANALAVGDANGDGVPDVFVAHQCVGITDCSSGGLGVLLGNGDGSFQTAVVYGSGGLYAYGIAAADVNGDGKADLLVADRCMSSGCAADGALAVLIGKGDGTFGAAVTYDSGGYGAFSVAVSDVNGDGKPDVAIANNCVSISDCLNGTVGVLLGNGNGTFQTAVPHDTAGYYANFVGVGDLNGDGKPDLVATNECVSLDDCGSSTVAVFLGIQVGTATTVTTSVSPSYIKQPVTFTATISSGGGQIPDGETVTFDEGSTQLGSGLTSHGTAKFTTSTLLQGAQYIKATYAGDAYFQGSSGAVEQVVKLYTSTTTLVSSPNPSTYGQAVELSATVKSSAPGGATGQVTFKKGTVSLGTVTLSSGKATLGIPTLPAGQLALSAVYSGDSQSGVSSGSDIQVVHMATTTTTLVSSINPSKAGRLVQFTATVTSSTTTPTGAVSFMDGSKVLGTTYLSNGKTTFGTGSLGVGSHNITAVYNGTTNIAGSKSAVLVQVVQ